MESTHFSYVQIGAKDYQALATFYENAIGFTPCDDTSWLNGQEGICLRAPGFADGTGPIFGFVPVLPYTSSHKSIHSPDSFCE